MAEFSFHHGGVWVPSLEEAIKWCGHVLGYEFEERFTIEAASAEAAMIGKGSLCFELFEVAGAAPLPGDRHHPPADLKTHGNKHRAFRVEDLDAFLAEMPEKQADIAFVVKGEVRQRLLHP